MLSSVCLNRFRNVLQTALMRVSDGNERYVTQELCCNCYEFTLGLDIFDSKYMR